MQYLKRLPFENIKNARDLGGVPTLDGKVLNWGRVLRTAALDDITSDEIELLKDYGVKSIIDLRRDGEIPFEDESHKMLKENFNWRQVSLAPDIDLRDEEIRKILNREISIGSTYRNLIDNFTKVKEIMEIIAQTDGVTLFHCQEGKDRTGIISMILMGLVDVSRSDIIADYEISSAYLGYVERYDEDEPYSVFRITNPYYMKEAYEYITRKYNTFEEYLEYAKVDKQTIDKIYAHLMD